MIMVLSTLRMPILGASALVSFLLLFPVLGLAQSSELESLRATVKGMEQQMQKALERIDQLEKEKILQLGANRSEVEKSVQGSAECADGA